MHASRRRSRRSFPRQGHPAAHRSQCGDDVPRLVDVQEDAAGGVTTYTYSYTPKPALFQFRHLVQERLFSVTAVDREPRYFRDSPTRYLVVEIDDETGEVRPAVKDRKPVYLWLCREERETR